MHFSLRASILFITYSCTTGNHLVFPQWYIYFWKAWIRGMKATLITSALFDMSSFFSFPDWRNAGILNSSVFPCQMQLSREMKEKLNEEVFTALQAWTGYIEVVEGCNRILRWSPVTCTFVSFPPLWVWVEPMTMTLPHLWLLHYIAK